MSGFRTEYSTPTDEQASLVGHIVMDCAILEFALGALVARLAGMPVLVGRALLGRANLSELDDRAVRLLKVHEERYDDKLIPYEHRLAIDAALRAARGVRKERNEFAHLVSLRDNDDALDFFALSRDVLSGDKTHRRQTLDSLRDLHSRIRAANEGLEAAISLIPEQPERWAERSASAAKPSE